MACSVVGCRLTAFLIVLLPLLILQGVLTSCDAKTISGKAKLTGAKTEHTVTKFALSPGGNPKVAATFSTGDKMYEDERSLKLYLYVDENWRDVRRAPTCEAKTRLARESQPLTFDLVRKPSRDFRKGNAGSYEATVHFTIDQTQVSRPRYWYITIADCSLEMYYHDESVAPPIEYTLRIWDELPHHPADVSGVSGSGGYSHLPSDERGMGTLHCANIVLSVALAVFVAFRARSVGMARGEVHFAAFVVFGACGLCALSSLCELVHLYVYSMDGIGFYFFDFLGAHCEALCDACIAVLLLAVAVGWTLPQDITVRLDRGEAGGTLVHAVEGLRDPAGAVKGRNPAGLLALGLVAVHSILAQWGRTYDDDFDCYHDLEHPPGKALFFFRIFLGFAFLLGVAGLRRNTHCGRGLAAFLAKFAAVGVSWFLALPGMAVFASSVVPAYRRHQVVSSWAAMVQLASLASLAWLFTAGSSASSYHKVSKVGGSSVDSLDSGAGGGGGGGGGGGNIGSSNGVGGLTFRFGKTKVRLD